jgi:hypothetical protein
MDPDWTQILTHAGITAPQTRHDRQASKLQNSFRNARPSLRIEYAPPIGLQPVSRIHFLQRYDEFNAL